MGKQKGARARPDKTDNDPIVLELRLTFRQGDHLARVLAEAMFGEAEDTLCHRPPAPREEIVVKEILTAGCIALMHLGVSGRQAALDIAFVAARRYLVRPGGKAVTHATVYDWWRRFRSENGSQCLADAILREAAPASRRAVVNQTSVLLDRVLGPIAGGVEKSTRLLSPLESA